MKYCKNYQNVTQIRNEQILLENGADKLDWHMLAVNLQFVKKKKFTISVKHNKMRYACIHFLLNNVQNIEPKGTTKTSYLNLDGLFCSFRQILSSKCRLSLLNTFYKEILSLCAVQHSTLLYLIQSVVLLCEVFTPYQFNTVGS